MRAAGGWIRGFQGMVETYLREDLGGDGAVAGVLLGRWWIWIEERETREGRAWRSGTNLVMS